MHLRIGERNAVKRPLAEHFVHSPEQCARALSGSIVVCSLFLGRLFLVRSRNDGNPEEVERVIPAHVAVYDAVEQHQYHKADQYVIAAAYSVIVIVHDNYPLRTDTAPQNKP